MPPQQQLPSAQRDDFKLIASFIAGGPKNVKYIKRKLDKIAPEILKTVGPIPKGDADAVAKWLLQAAKDLEMNKLRAIANKTGVEDADTMSKRFPLLVSIGAKLVPA